MKKSLLVSCCVSILMLSGITAAGATEIGVAWAGKSGMTNRVTAGFDKGMKELAPDIKIEYKKELGSVDELAEVAGKWGKEKNGMVLLRSTAAKWLGQNPPAIPTFIGGCNNPMQLGAVKNLEAPEGNITGVTYSLPIDTQFEIFQAIIPDLKSLLLLLEKGHPSCPIEQAETKAVCEKLGIAYHERSCATWEEAVKAVDEFKGKVSVIIIGNQGMNIDNAENIVKAAGNTPVLSYSAKPVKVGALGGFVADDGKLGYMLAESVVAVLKNGKSVKEVAVKVDPEPKFYINTKTAEALKLDIPYTILETATVVQ
jgi:putative tryptophan/tyrosine transport system substrate-binding protein